MNSALFLSDNPMVWCISHLDKNTEGISFFIILLSPQIYCYVLINLYILIDLSQLPEIMLFLSLLYVTLVTVSSWPYNGSPIYLNIWAFQNIIVLSLLPETIVFASGLNSTLYTYSACPVNGSPIYLNVWASQSLIVLSSLPETMVFPFGA